MRTEQVNKTLETDTDKSKHSNKPVTPRKFLMSTLNVLMVSCKLEP